MPELPEVETVRRHLATCLPGLVVGDLRVYDATVSSLSEEQLRSALLGRRVRSLRRRGKYLIVDCGDVIVVVHLRMTGRLVFEAQEEPRRPRLTIAFEPAAGLFFYDTRRFGRVWAMPAAQESAFFAAVGVEPLDDEFTLARLRALLDARRAPLKAFLLDQRHIAGIGNIYADEALFRARLHPLRPAGAVGPREAQRLHAAIREVLRQAIEHAGSSVDSFVDPEGSPGSFQDILNVYQRTGEPCRVCGTAIRRITLGGRGTHFCPHCQPRRRSRRPPAVLR